MRYRNKCLIQGATHFQPSPTVGALHGALGIFFCFVGHYFPADLLWHFAIRLLSIHIGAYQAHYSTVAVINYICDTNRD